MPPKQTVVPPSKPSLKKASDTFSQRTSVYRGITRGGGGDGVGCVDEDSNSNGIQDDDTESCCESGSGDDEDDVEEAEGWRRKIFIGGLARDTTLDTFVKYFEKYGEITDSVIMKDRHTGRPRGFGFITYADPSVVDQVIQEDHVINGKQVEIKRTIPKGAAQENDFKTKKIFVGGIPSMVTEEELKNFFSKYGKVVEHEIIRDHTTKRSRGFGFVVFDNEKVVDNILTNGNMIDMAGTQVEIKKAEPKKSSNPAPHPPFGSDSRARPYGDAYGGFGDSFSSFGGGSFGPAPYRSLGGFGGRLGDYGGYGGGDDFGGSFGGYGGSGFAGYRGDSSFGYSSRYGSYMGSLGAGYGGGGGLGAYGRGSGSYESYGGPGSGGGYDSGPSAGYGGAGGLYGSRGSYGGSSRYHPYAR
ncbi:heterogeneous nuclear ribonucleoprotein 1-like [Senna tora]|uniref:Heterogeneous nuclear ribonucleoprotein 1-like n=1 Tax=Senna tora TaxID=362788 RepID=A0A835C588_9FABA|nr:heterogeneous nuclear ribonucleoprotein 1-like [Senna tora]